MSARTRTAGQAIRRWWIVPAVLISVTTGLGSLLATPQAALATARGASSISAGGNQSCAIQSGKAYCWGGNQDGQLGNGTTTNSGVPVAVDTSGVLPGQILAQISAGDDSNTCALSRTGKAYCWGDNEFGGLGDASTAGSGVPVAVDTSGVLAGKTLTQITTGGVTCALDSTGAAYCWGGNAPAALGDASTSPSSVPVAVDTSGVLAGKALTQITTGADHTCALDSTGKAYCWGYNQSGALGNGQTGPYSAVPVAVDTSGVLAGKTLTQITAGNRHTCALDSTGAAYCWGGNQFGQLGDANPADSSVPVTVDTSGVLAGQTLIHHRRRISHVRGGCHWCRLLLGIEPIRRAARRRPAHRRQYRQLQRPAGSLCQRRPGWQDTDPDQRRHRTHVCAGQNRRGLLLGRQQSWGRRRQHDHSKGRSRANQTTAW
jgi:alpha-tubulin suppressor-like RCC1 family protein